MLCFIIHCVNLVWLVSLNCVPHSVLHVIGVSVIFYSFLALAIGDCTVTVILA